MGDRLAEVTRFFVLRRFDLPARFGKPGTCLGSDAAAAVVDVLGHGVHPRLRGEQRLLQSPGEPLGGCLFFGDGGQQPAQVGVGFGQSGERGERIG